MKGALWLERPKIWPQNPEIILPLSKSISNRILILEALSGGRIKANEHSNAKDTLLLQKILKNPEEDIWNAQDAGTAFRFLTAYAATGNHPVVLDGTSRMRERPISPLAEALEYLGVLVEYLKKEGYPPLKVYPPENGLQSKSVVRFNDTKSSQFISALMLIAPVIKNGLRIAFPYPFPSFGYLELTAEVLCSAGLRVDLSESEVFVPEQSFQNTELQAESDWSSASYFYALFLAGEWKEMTLKNIDLQSSQPDSVVAGMYKELGVDSVQTSNDVNLLRSVKNDYKNLELDFSNCPDIAMTLIVSCALKKINLRIKGIQNLIYKESNRIEILQRELSKINCSLTEEQGFWQLDSGNLNIPDEIEINPEHDHRIALIEVISRVHI
jgi:3-phosphoshikimate 1-carboxyvinyltransferase